MVGLLLNTPYAKSLTLKGRIIRVQIPQPQQTGVRKEMGPDGAAARHHNPP